MDVITRKMRLLALCALSLMCTNCKLIKKDERTSKLKGILDASFVFIERTPSRREAVVRFRTTVVAKCHFRYWSNNPQSKNSISSPLEQKCEGTEPRLEFSEVLKNLSPSDLYTFEINVWGRKGSFEQAEKIIVSEGDDALDPNDMFFARVNLPLRTTEINRHKASSPPNNQFINQIQRSDFGCKKNIDKESPFSNAHKTFKLENLAFDGFVTGEGKAHERNSKFRRIRFNTVASGSEWEWKFANHGKQYSFFLKPATMLTSIKVTGGSNEIEINDTQITIAPKEIFTTAAGSADVEISWTTSNPLPNSYVEVMVGNNAAKNSFNCIFDTNAGKGVISKDLIAGLDKKRHDLYVSVVSLQMDISQGQDRRPPWLVETRDWKLGRLAVE